MKHILVILSLSVLLFSCGNGGTDNGAPATVNGTSVNANNGPDKYTVTVNDLRLRETPDLKGNVLSTLKEGDQVEYLGETSKNHDEVVLRGVKYFEPWLKVKTSDGKIGWAYGGAVRLVSAMVGGQSETLDNNLLNDFIKYIEPLDKKQAPSAKKALDFVATKFANANKATCEAAYKEYQHLARTIADNLFATFDQDAKLSNNDYNAIMSEVYEARDGKMVNMQRNAYTKMLDESGFRFEATEGSLFVVVNEAATNRVFLPLVSPAMQEYLKEEQYEGLNPSNEDAGLIISEQELAERVIFWDKFLEENPSFSYANEAKLNYQNNLGNLLTGLDNTPAFSYEDGTLLPDLKKAFEQIISQHGATKTGKTIQEFMNILQKSGFKKNADVEAFYKRTIPYYGDGN